MPQQQIKRKVDASAVQGKGAYIEFVPLTWGESEDLAKESAAHEDDAQWRSDQTKDLYARHIAGWNWADADGNLFPLPSDDPDVLRKLTLDEVTFIDNLFEVKRDPKR